MQRFSLLPLALCLSMAATAETPTQLLWGDTHNHTGNSFDVYLFGTPTSTPETAYRFAKGEPVINPTTGTRWQIDEPLDFLVVADHAELMGAMPRLFDEKDPLLTNTKSGKEFLRLGGSKTEEALLEVYNEMQYAVYGQPTKFKVTGEEITKDLHAGDKRVGRQQ